MSTYDQPPVRALLQLGEDAAQRQPWPDYLAMGFTDEHVAELIRLAGDQDLYNGSDDDALGPEQWAPIHAWRTLGQLGAIEAIGPLLDQLRWEDSDAVLTEIPTVLAMIGPAAIPALRIAMGAYSLTEEPWPAAAVADALLQLAERRPEARDEALRAVVDQLGGWAEQDPALNGLLIGRLLDAKAVEAAPVMEAAFEAGAVDESITGDWEDAQVALGLLQERITPRPRFSVDSFDEAFEPVRKPALDSKARDKAKRKRKAEKAARQRNRKKRKR